MTYTTALNKYKLIDRSQNYQQAKNDVVVLPRPRSNYMPPRGIIILSFTFVSQGVPNGLKSLSSFSKEQKSLSLVLMIISS